MAQRFFVAIPQDDGGIQIQPMKSWLANNPVHLPTGMDARASNSHSLARGLQKAGWKREESETEVRLLFPGTHSEDVLGEEEPSIEDAAETAFALEYQLRDFIANNLARIDVAGRRLRLYQDSRGDGIEYSTDIGRIDILAVDDNGAFYVFELKRARSPDAAVGQVARYMGWLRQGIGRGRPVNGVIVAREISPYLRYAADAMPNLSLFEYKVSFALEPVVRT
jgi:hypothetical protein